jgi:hypothetical protein
MARSFYNYFLLLCEIFTTFKEKFTPKLRMNWWKIRLEVQWGMISFVSSFIIVIVAMG